MGKGIAVAGNIILDIIKEIDKYPVRHQLAKVSRKQYSLGGCVDNTGRDLARLDPTMPVRFIGLVGEDGEGDEILRQLKEYPNIDTSMVKRRGQTSFTDVLSEIDTGARTFLFFGGGSDQFDVEDVPVDELDCDLFHVGYILLLEALDKPDPVYGTRMARLLASVQAKGILTSVDVVSEDSDRYSAIVPPALRYTDYFIVNEIESGKTVGLPLRDEKDRLLPERIPEVLRRLKDLGVSRWVVIHAPEGGFGLDENDHYVALPSLALPKGFIAGSVGAGDAFCAGVLHAAYKGYDIEQAIRDGIATAAASLRTAGASDGVECIEKMRALYDSMPKQQL
ncbi:MAG: carbohydrate kinase family protein [Clostridia bacterium]|nr:carbohydrate kinase family protein [Clostridia bacterium]